MDPGGGVRFLAPDPGGRVAGIALAGEPLGVWQHWDGRPYLCEISLDLATCARCMAGCEKRWKGFLPLNIEIGGGRGKLVILEVTREAWQKFLAGRLTAESANLLGWDVAETRAKGSKFAPCMFYRLERWHPEARFVDVRCHVARLYSVHKLHAL